MKKTLCGQEKFLSVQRFLLDRKLRCISYQVKSVPCGSHCGEKEFVASRPVAGGESCQAGFYFQRFVVSLYRKLEYNENRTFQEKSREQTFLFTGGTYQ